MDAIPPSYRGAIGDVGIHLTYFMKMDPYAPVW